MSWGRVSGKVALVTGAGRGQGRAHAVRQAEEGADVIAIDICRQIESVPYDLATTADLAETAAQVEALDRRVLAIEADVRDAEQMTGAVRDAVAELGRLDIVVANAGIHSTGAISELSPGFWQDVIDVNLTGVWNTVRAGVPPIRDGGRGGSIVMTGSTAAVRGFANQTHYTAAKTGVVGLMRSLVNELGEFGIRVNVIHPSAVDTRMVHNPNTYEWLMPDSEDRGREAFGEMFEAMHPLPAPWADPRDIANAALFLTSDEARYVSGTELKVDLGFCEKQ